MRYTHRILTFVLFFVIAPALLAQGWTQIPAGTTKGLRGVFSASTSMTVAVGDGGLVIGTTDGGVTWSSGNAGTTEDLNKVFVMNTFSPVIAVVGNNGTMRYSTNVGLTWGTWNGGTNEDLYDIFPHDPTVGSTMTVVGDNGVILFSNNSGATWVFRLSPVPKPLRGVFFPTLVDGVIVGDGGVILHTTNGGAAWTQITSGTSTNLNHVFFTDANNGFIVGDGGLIMNTTDGGLTWSTVSSPVNDNLERLFFASPTNGWAVGEGGRIIATTDGGSTWDTQGNSSTRDLHSVFFVDPLNGMAVGDRGVVLKTTNGGVPVELSAFSAIPGAGGIALQWTTQSEDANYGFEVQRRTRTQDRTASDWSVLGFVPGAGNSRSARTYHFTDPQPGTAGEVQYRLRQIDLDGSFAYSPTITVEAVPPAAADLSAAPNPARGESLLRVRIPTESMIRLQVFAMDGRRVASLHDGILPAGTHAFRWDASGLPAGTYVAALDAPAFHRRFSIILTP